MFWLKAYAEIDQIAEGGKLKPEWKDE